MRLKWDSSSEMIGKNHQDMPPPIRGFNGSVNISERCDFRSQFDPFYIIFSLFLKYFLSAYTCWIKKYEINESVSLKMVELLTKTRFTSNKRNWMLLTLLVRGGPRA